MSKTKRGLPEDIDVTSDQKYMFNTDKHLLDENDFQEMMARSYNVMPLIKALIRQGVTPIDYEMEYRRHYAEIMDDIEREKHFLAVAGKVNISVPTYPPGMVIKVARKIPVRIEES